MSNYLGAEAKRRGVVEEKRRGVEVHYPSGQSRQAGYEGRQADRQRQQASQ